MAVTLSDFLSSVPLSDGIHQISPPRPFQHAEEEYDSHRPADQWTPEFISQEGANLVAFFQAHGYSPGTPILEIGCGSGFMTASLATQPAVGHLLATDPSPAFCRIARRKIADFPNAAARVDFGVMLAEDVHLITPGAVPLIFLRSVLHHIADVDDFLAKCASVLPKGGLLICEEPYYDGYVMMGFLAQFIPDALAAAGHTCTDDDHAHINNFIATMQFYARRDLDKSEAEDKHLFRPDELFVSARAVGLDLHHHPNWHVTIAADKNLANRIGYFENFFAFYIRKCMGWPQPLVDRVIPATRKYFRYFAPLESATNTAPYCFGTFVFTKR
jgi:SAM-dependent methyltransferase